MLSVASIIAVVWIGWMAYYAPETLKRWVDKAHGVLTLGGKRKPPK